MDRITMPEAYYHSVFELIQAGEKHKAVNWLCDNTQLDQGVIRDFIDNLEHLIDSKPTELPPPPKASS